MNSYKAQLRQPLNTDPIQPHLTESSLSIHENIVSQTPSYNEFTPLFTRNRATLSASLFVGGDNTWGDEMALSGLYNQYSFNVGQLHYQTDGFRENNDQEIDIYTGFFQTALTPNTSIQGEIRQFDLEEGDLVLYFNPDVFDTDVRQTVDVTSYRFGLHHIFSPNSDFIGYFNYQDWYDQYGWPGFDWNTDRKEFLAEVQHLFKKHDFDIISGAGHSQTDAEDTIFNQLDLRYTNIYLYTYLHSLNNFTWTVGASGNFVDDELYSIEKEQFNPKLGVTWTPSQSTTFRAAWFRNLRRNMISDQTTEPTQIAGFNQFFDDLILSDTWHYGAAVDHQFSSTLFGGTEISRREIEFPFLDIGENPDNRTAQFDEYDEDVVRTYIYWIPNNRLSTKAEFLYELFEKDQLGYYSNLETYKLPLSISTFFPNGFSAHLTATFIHQEGDFGDPLYEPVVSSDDDFWTVDCALSYRLPNKLGKISIEAKNLFDEGFQYQDTDFLNPKLYPEQIVLLKLTLNLF